MHWQCKALSDEASLQAITLQPHPCVSGDDLTNLKCLNLFESCMLQINDHCFLKYSSCDTTIKKSDWESEQSVKFKLIFEQQKECNQKIFVKPPLTGPGAGGSGSGGGLHHHYEKLRKKLSLGLDDKTANKLKRSLFKGDKFSNNYNRDTNTNRKQNSPSHKKDDNEWISIEEDEDDDCADDVFDVREGLKHYNPTDDAISTTTTMSTGSSPSRTSPIHLTKRQLKKKARKNFKKPFLGEAKKDFIPKEGEELTVEVLLVYSTATVVWQDGTIESDIPSTELYPIHHLDNHVSICYILKCMV